MGLYQSLQGNLGLSKAINYYVSQGYCVSIPLNDTQGYDLIVEKNGVMQRVQVKTSRNKVSQFAYQIGLRNTGGENKTRKINFDKTKSDLLFVYTSDGNIYNIPTENISAINAINVRPEGGPYSQFLVFEKTFEEFDKECRD